MEPSVTQPILPATAPIVARLAGIVAVGVDGSFPRATLRRSAVFEADRAVVREVAIRRRIGVAACGPDAVAMCFQSSA